MLFALGIVSIPVSAHFTLGQLRGTYDFHDRDYDPHVPGVIGYVMPGAGYFTTELGAMRPEYPGYQSPYPGGNPGTLGSGYAGLGYPTSYAGYYPPAWYQLDANNYAPFGAILANTIKPSIPPVFATTWWGNPTIEGLPIELGPDSKPNSRGDLLFAFNATDGFGGANGANYTELFLWVPPEFTSITTAKVQTSWTNNYDGIDVRRGDLDKTMVDWKDGSIDYWSSMYAPGWTVVRVHADRGSYYNGTSFDHHTGYMTGGQKDPVLGSDIFAYPRCMNFTSKGEWYYLALRDVVAPAIAGRYFFKVGFRTPNMTMNRIGGVANQIQYYLDGSMYFEWMPIQNWPVLTVKGEVDPAIITGSIRFGGYNTTLYGQNVSLSGRVRAVGIADDPYTGVSLNKPVEARGYFNQTALGHYEVEGVAPGVYDIYASCAGYPELKIASGVKIQKGQSYHIDGYLTPGAVVHGTVYSKCGTGEVQWGAISYAKIEIYSAAKTTAADVAGVKPASRFSALKEDITKAYETSITKTAKMPVTWSPWGYPATLGEPEYIADGRPKYAWAVGQNGISAADTATKQFPWFVGLADPLYDSTQARLGMNPDGVGPRQPWRTTAASTSFTWRFGDQGKYGAPSDWTGHVPEYNATWVNGLPAGQYYTRGWVLGYVQVQPDGVTFEHASFTIAPSEFPGDIYIPFDLRKGSIVSKTVHFHDVQGTLTQMATLPHSHFRWGMGSKSSPYGINVRLYIDDSAGFSWGYSGSLYSSIGPYTFTVSGRNDYNYAGRSYGMPAGDYKLRDKIEGFIQDPDQWVSLGLCGTTITVSNHVYYGARFNITIFAKDWEHPTVDQIWKYDNDLCYVGIYKDGKLVGVAYTWTDLSYKPVALNITNWFSDRSITGNYAWDTGLYELKAFVYGYVQKKPVQVYVTRGALADVLIKVCEGAQVPVTMKFKREQIFRNFWWNASMRVRLFDDANKLVAEYLTSDPWHGYLSYNSNNRITTQQAGVSVTWPTQWGLYPNDHDLNYVPGVTETLQLSLCGTPDLRFWWFDRSPDPAFDLAWQGYGSSMVWAPYGIDAAPNYMGGYRVEVDVVPWYDGTLAWTATNKYYPPIAGILYGESPKYIPENHLGPWQLSYPITVPGNHLGGESSLYFELDVRGSMGGQVLGYTWCDDWRPTSWAAVVFTGADGKVVERVPSFDGRYFAYLPTGAFSMTIMHGGYVSPKTPVFVTDGGFGLRNYPLERANVPIPEFPVAAVVLAFSLAASLFILRRRRK